MTTGNFILISLALYICAFIMKTKALASQTPSLCSNTNNRFGLCLPMLECKSFLNAMKCAEPKAAILFSQQSKCNPNGQISNAHYCCTCDTGYLMLPKPPTCGPIAFKDRIYGGTETELGEFPWLAVLEYKNNFGVLEDKCAGNIISQRYVLTAAHCIKGPKVLNRFKLVSVRVGEHNTETIRDCKKSVCLDVYQRLLVAKVIVHSGYGSYSGSHNNHDIALIRTKRNIKFSISVAPICLPDSLAQKSQLAAGVRFFVAGWGRTEKSGASAEKRKVELSYVKNEVCPFKVIPEQLCAGSEYGRDSCVGDSGAGLVRLAHSAWVLEGIVSYGVYCGLGNPGIYTRISSYVPWIVSNMQP